MGERELIAGFDHRARRIGRRACPSGGVTVDEEER
jgi:hypothetical protein